MIRTHEVHEVEYVELPEMMNKTEPFDASLSHICLALSANVFKACSAKVNFFVFLRGCAHKDLSTFKEKIKCI